MKKQNENFWLDNYVNKQIEGMNPCDYKKVKFREAVSEQADNLANQYVEQFKQGLLFWSELGEKLVELHNFEVEVKKAIKAKEADDDL